MPRIRVTQLEPPEPWERQPTESRAASAAFATYRDQQGRRSLRRVAQTVGKTPSVIANWSVQHRWVVADDAPLAHWRSLPPAFRPGGAFARSTIHFHG